MDVFYSRKELASALRVCQDNQKLANEWLSRNQIALWLHRKKGGLPRR